jgi:manganese transport protein
MPVWRRIPVFLRRAITVIPALVLLAVGFNPTRALVLSQVFLSFGIPFALIPLLAFTAKRSVMGPWSTGSRPAPRRSR